MDDVIVDPPEYRSSHKFGHNPLAEAVWDLSLEGWHSEEAGTTETIGWFALLHIEEKEVRDLGYNSAIVSIPVGSYILEQQDSGAVYVSRYPLRGSEVSEDWRKILAAESDAYDETEEYDDVADDISEAEMALDRANDAEDWRLSPADRDDT